MNYKVFPETSHQNLAILQVNTNRIWSIIVLRETLSMPYTTEEANSFKATKNWALEKYPEFFI